MWRTIIILLICSYSTSRFFLKPKINSDTGKMNSIDKYSLYPYHTSESELCLSPTQTINNLIIPVEKIKIDNILFCNQTDEFTQVYKQKKLVNDILENLNLNYAFEKKSLLESGLRIVLLAFPISQFISFGSLFLYEYYRIKFIIYLWECIMKNIERRRHIIKLIAYMIFLLILRVKNDAFLKYCNSYINYYLGEYQFSNAISVDEYTVYFKHDDQVKLCFTKKYSVTSLETLTAALMFNPIFFSQEGVPLDIFQQTEQLTSIVNNESFTFIRIKNIILVLCHFVLGIYSINYDLYYVKRRSNRCHKLQEKIDSRITDEAVLTIQKQE